jgi:transcriptional regulator with XRE-family HTH domain
MNDNGTFLKELKEREKMSYTELSELTGIPKDTLANWILGRREPPDYVINLLKDKLKVN